MSVLMKNMWRNILKSTSTYSLRSLSSNISELTIPKPADPVMGTIRSANSSAAVLAAIQQHLAQLDHRHMLQALRTLFQLQRSSTRSDDSERLVNDPAFATFCQNFKRHARELDINETIEAIKVLSYLQVQADSLIVQTMLQLVRSNINFINIRQVIFLDFLLSKFTTRNHLVDALKLALPLVFQIHLPMELDHQDLRLLKDMLSYACTHDLPDRCINNMVTALLLHDQAIDAQIARSIIWSLCDVNCTEEVYPTRVQLLHICYDILSVKMDKLSYDEVLRTTAKIKGRILEKHPEYYHEQLMDAAAGYVVTRELSFEKALLVARVMSRIAHTNLKLIEYLCRLAGEEPTLVSHARVNILFGFVNCLSNSNYVPPAWERLRSHVSQNAVLDAKTTALPWTKFCLELASLGHYDDKLLQRVFSPEFLQDYLSREDNTLDYLQLLTLHEATRSFHSTDFSMPEHWVLRKAKELYPVHGAAGRLAAALAKGVGGEEHVATSVALPSGIVADVLMCLKGSYPVVLNRTNNKTKTPIQELNLPADGLVVCLLNFNQGCFSMNSNRLRGTFRLLVDILENQGYVTVPINVNEWSRAPAHEHTPYLMREVNYKCGEIGTKLCAT